MQSGKTKAELQQQKTKLANSYTELLEEFYAHDLRHVGSYSLGKLIGKGSFGKVYLARHDLCGSRVVLKASKKDDPNLAREVHHHRQFIHPHIARLYEVIVTESTLWLVLEYCQGDELYNYLCKSGALPVETAQKIFTQLVGAVAYIHSKSCVHRDLKLENVLLDKHDNVKLCDFGFTREYEGKSSYLSTFCGTVCYSAPEMLKGEKYAGEKVDVWSLGIILYALLKGELPFDEDDDMATKAKILKDEPDYPATFPEGAKTLISKLLSKRPFHRPTLAEIMADPFLGEHAPKQQEILKLTQPAPFTTDLEKATLERMKSAGVDIDKVIENVLAQRCDTLAGWWNLLIEKEARKQARRERKRKEKEADLRVLRRLSGASGQFKFSSALAEVAEEGSRLRTDSRNRSSSRGRSQRRSTPQILVTDLPQLPEGSAIQTPLTEVPPPIDRYSKRSGSGSRPPLPPKDRQRRQSSTLAMVTINQNALGPVNGVVKKRVSKRRSNQFLNQLNVFKQWFKDSTKRSKSPGKTDSSTSGEPKSSPKEKLVNGEHNYSTTNNHHRVHSGASAGTRSSYGPTLTPITSNAVLNTNGHLVHPPVDSLQAHRHRNSISPSPLTPRSSYRHNSGLRGRKSTSSSVSSVRSMPRHASHSKTSSRSSNSLDTIHSPGTRSAARSPHPSVKVLPVTPTSISFIAPRPPPTTTITNNGTSTPPSSTMSNYNDSQAISTGPTVMFARRKKSPFSGPKLNPSLFGSRTDPSIGSPAFVPRQREGSATHLNVALRELGRKTGGAANTAKRKSQIIEEEEEDESAPGVLTEQDEEAVVEQEEEEEEVEEVDAFSPVEIDLTRGERVESVVIWDDPSPLSEAQPKFADMSTTAKDGSGAGVGVGILSNVHRVVTQ